ncbi:MAG: hypothetical protein ABSG78_13375 [Verrucomicrobiota bacterium]|jgi:hypothetical protein
MNKRTNGDMMKFYLTSTLLVALCSGDVFGASSNTTTVPLEYQETSNAFLFRNVPIERRTVPFPKEPAPVSGRVVRGVLKFGDNPGNGIPFLWQSGAKKLFLGLNHKQDLRDDSAGMFSARVMWSSEPTFIIQMFTNIHLSFPASSGGVPMLMDLQFALDTARRPGQPLCNAALRSYWQGKVTVEGHDWQAGLVQNLSDDPGSFRQGQLLLRPWEEWNRPFSAFSEPGGTYVLPWTEQNCVVRASDTFAFSPRVFFEGHACLLDWSAEPRGREDKLALQLTQQQTALGELRITGSFIQRLVLTGERYVVVLDHPAASVKVPTDRYQPYRVWLKQGRTRAYFNYGLPQTGKANVLEEVTGAKLPVLSPPPPEQAIAVDEQRPAVLAVGGPLTNSVSATRQGRELILSHRLIGGGGGEYRVWQGTNRIAPQFTVRKSGKEIGAGQFEFG